MFFLKRNRTLIPWVSLQINSKLKLKFNQVFLWSDSSTILKYLKNEKANFGQYIMHRSNEITNNSNLQDWRYIPSDLNVADNCSGGTKFNDLSNKHRWIIGPSFLYQQTIHFEQDSVRGFGSNEVINSPFNINLYYSLEDINLSKRQFSYAQIVTLPFD